MFNILKKFSRAKWTVLQPLVIQPKNKSVPVSDLFIWRRGINWETFFELTDMVGMYDEDNFHPLLRSVEIVFFDFNGKEISRNIIPAPLHKRELVNISEMVPEHKGEYGTFCVLHQTSPEHIIGLKGNLSERGYVSYAYMHSILRAYVHGNLNAICKTSNGNFQKLGGSSFLRREYRLQYEIIKDNEYEVALVNSSNSAKSIELILISTDNGFVVNSYFKSIPSGGSYVFHIKPELNGLRVVIRSRLVMARPLVFVFNNRKMTVFHG